MKISIETLNNIEKDLGSFEVGVGHSCLEEILTLRFGYWRKVDIEKLQSYLPNHIDVFENIVDEDEECGGELYNYMVKTNIVI